MQVAYNFGWTEKESRDNPDKLCAFKLKLLPNLKLDKNDLSQIQNNF